MTPVIAAPAVAFAVSFAAVWWLARGSARKLALDQPNERSLHSQPVPRLGGAGIFAGVFAAWALLQSGVPGLMLPLWFASALLAAVSLREDMRGVPMRWRFLAHLVAAVAFVGATLWSAERLWLIPFLVVGIVWVTNLYNFMDGSDGLAGGMAVFGFGAYGAAAWLSGDAALSSVSFSLVTASLAFLWFNFSPAKIFMGDVGAIPLGFLAAGLGSFGWSRGVWPFWFPLMVFSPFWVDATVTLLARQLRGEKVWQAHRSHYYQRLVLMGWGHRKVALAEYALMAALATTGLAIMREAVATQAALVGGWVIVYAAGMRLIDSAWARFQREAAIAPRNR